MNDSPPKSLNESSTRREYLRYAAFTVGLGASGGYGVTQLSQPAIANSNKPVTLKTGLTEGKINISSYEIQYANLDPSEDITIEYILTINGSLQNEANFQSHVVPISETSGVVTTGQHSITVPAGEIGLQVRVHHPSLGSKTAVTASNNPVLVQTAGIPSKDELYANFDITQESYSDGEEIGGITDQTGNGNDLTLGRGNPRARHDSINGYNSVYFDDWDTVYGSVNVSPPYHMFAVRKGHYNSSNPYYEFSTSNNVALYTQDYSFRITDGANTIGSSERVSEEVPKIVSMLFDTDGELRVNGKTQATGDLSANSLGRLHLSKELGSEYGKHMWWGQLLIYPKDMSSKQAEIEEKLASKWDIPLK